MEINQIAFQGALCPAKTKRLGVIALASDLTIERDLPRMLPPDAEMFVNRVQNTNPLTLENLRAMRGDIARAAAGLLPGRGVDAAVYACTSGSAAIGGDAVCKLVQTAHPQTPVTTPLAALDAACAALNIKKLSILTPYSAEINRALGECQTAAGREVININGLGFDDDVLVADIPPEAVVRYAADAVRPQADALFISCTALRAAEVAEEIERAAGIPVLTSNQILAWHGARLLQCARPLSGFGALLREAA
ncbi:MAG: maleate cis-trans isomerase family protein [Gammaproteobacteria bacterium]